QQFQGSSSGSSSGPSSQAEVQDSSSGSSSGSSFRQVPSALTQVWLKRSRSSELQRQGGGAEESRWPLLRRRRLATKNRVVETGPHRRPGAAGKEYDPFLETRLSPARPNCQGTKTLRETPSWGRATLGQEVNAVSAGPRATRAAEERNPLEQPENGNSGAEDRAEARAAGRARRASTKPSATRSPAAASSARMGTRCTSTPAGRRPWHQRAVDDSALLQAQREANSFKDRQKSTFSATTPKRGGRCNPHDWRGRQEFSTSPGSSGGLRAKGSKKSNPVTGEKNCRHATPCPNKLNEKHAKSGQQDAKGVSREAWLKLPFTTSSSRRQPGQPGRNCKSFDFNIESKSKSAGSSPRKKRQRGETGHRENCAVYAVIRQRVARPSPSKPKLNENLSIAKSSTWLRQLLSMSSPPDQSQQLRRLLCRRRKNPLTGEEREHFVLKLRSGPTAAEMPRGASQPRV
uniref:EZH1 methyltransferase n=1 Tax=Macrostomum lignano TaxID=282301 RepID=A0A1I8F680_9PLAT